MKQTLLLFLFSICISQAFSQELVNKFSEDFGNFKKSQGGWTITNEEGITAWFLKHKTDFKVKFLDKNLKQIGERLVSIPAKSKDYEEFIAGSFSDGKFNALFSSGKIISVEIAEKTSFASLPEFSKRYRLLKAYSYNNKLYQLSVIKNSSKLIVYEISTLTKIKVFKFDLTQLNGVGSNLHYHAKVSSIGSKEIRFSLIDSTGFYGSKFPNVLLKAYPSDKKITLIADIKSLGGTHFFDLSLETGKYSHQLLEMTGNTSNSFLFENNLYVLNSFKRKAILRIYSVEDKFNKIKEITFDKQENGSVRFNNSGLKKVGFSFDKSVEKDLQNPNRLFTRMGYENCFVSVCRSEDEGLLLTLGSYTFVPPQANYNAVMPGIVSGVVTSAFPVLSDAYFKNIYFESRLDRSALEYLTGEIEAAMKFKKDEIIDLFYNNLSDVTMPCKTQIEIDGKFYFGHYRKDLKEYRFYQVTE
ncbi:MAG: hypothetical protein ACI85I_002784 [Arenicella sp.]|jgi:hypothetical protein